MLSGWFSRQRRSGDPGWTEEDARRFEEEALSHLDALYRTALRLTRRPQDAEDLVQETYERAFRFADRFAPGTNLRAWLFKILTNAFISRYRRTTREPEATSLDNTEEYFLYHQIAGQQEQALTESAEEEMLARFVDQDVQRALEEVPEQFRLPVLLHDVEGFSYKEIAEIVGVPMGTVMSRLSRGRRLLQRSLWQFVQESGYVKEEEGP